MIEQLAIIALCSIPAFHLTYSSKCREYATHDLSFQAAAGDAGFLFQMHLLQLDW
jgi:hypothetical protein